MPRKFESSASSSQLKLHYWKVLLCIVQLSFFGGFPYRFHPQTLMGQAQVVPKNRLGIDNSRRNPQALYWEKPQLAKIKKIIMFSGSIIWMGLQDIPIRCDCKPLHETPEIWTWKKGPHLGILQTSLVGGFFTPLKNMKVNGDDDIPNIGKIKLMFQTTNQVLFRLWPAFNFRSLPCSDSASWKANPQSIKSTRIPSFGGIKCYWLLKIQGTPKKIRLIVTFWRKSKRKIIDSKFSGSMI